MFYMEADFRHDGECPRTPAVFPRQRSERRGSEANKQIGRTPCSGLARVPGRWEQMNKRPQHLTTGQLIAVVAGNALEFYDFLVFSIFAIQIGQVFFPGGSETASLLKTLAVFGA